GISETTVRHALDLSVRRECSLFAALQLPELRGLVTTRAANAIAEFVAQLDHWETQLNTPLVAQCAVLRSIVEESGYYDDLRRSCKTEDEALARETNVREIIEGLARFQEGSTDGLRGYLDSLALRQEKEEDKE